MVILETLRNSESVERLPLPGTFEHLEYLATLDTTSLPQSPEDFLDDTYATRTIGLFTKRLRVFRPIRTNIIELDSRLFDTEEQWIPVFSSSIHRNNLRPNECRLNIHGQPQPWELGENNYTYDLSIPVDFQFFHDPTRPIHAVYRYGSNPTPEVFNQAAHSRYKEDDPEILKRAIKQSAWDMARLIKYTYGVDAVPSYAQVQTEQEADYMSSRRAGVAQKVANLLK